MAHLWFLTEKKSISQNLIHHHSIPQLSTGSARTKTAILYGPALAKTSVYSSGSSVASKYRRQQWKAPSAGCPATRIWIGLDWKTSPRKTSIKIMTIDHEAWKKEVINHEELFATAYDKLPKEFLFMRELLLSALWRSPEKWGLAEER